MREFLEDLTNFILNPPRVSIVLLLVRKLLDAMSTSYLTLPKT